MLQQPGIEGIARSIVERPAAQMMQAAGPALQAQVPADKREAVGKSDRGRRASKYVDEATPVLRERAIKLAPSTFGAALEEKFTEDELKQLIAWLESPVNKKFQQTRPRDAERLRAEAGRRGRARCSTRSCRRCSSKLRATLGAPPRRRRRCTGRPPSGLRARRRPRPAAK